ncbi:hypothetical protein [Puniceibacterium sp. IMCC21224]|uniref:hypothetical protein n=1 Tax=Puniceibacterium sp. IMCC21224 TaxID=1618204 RepID=UPI0012E07567|nr:hypothetical protein [Puniceibacterium sp. IMCC21224]
MRFLDHFKRHSAEPKVVSSYEAATPSQRRFGGGSQSFGHWASETSAAREHPSSGAIRAAHISKFWTRRR